MKLKINRVVILGGIKYRIGIHDIDGLKPDWFFDALVKGGEIQILDSAVSPTFKGLTQEESLPPPGQTEVVELIQESESPKKRGRPAKVD